MVTTDFTTAILVNQTPKEVFNAVNNVVGWWQGEINGSTEKLNDIFTYRMDDFHFSTQKLVEVIPYEKVVWQVTESRLTSFKNQDEWTGTKIVFEISEIHNKTQLRFTHFGLVNAIACYDACSNAWSQLVQQSLFSLITTGKGFGEINSKDTIIILNKPYTDYYVLEDKDQSMQTKKKFINKIFWHKNGASLNAN